MLYSSVLTSNPVHKIRYEGLHSHNPIFKTDKNRIKYIYIYIRQLIPFTSAKKTNNKLGKAVLALEQAVLGWEITYPLIKLHKEFNPFITKLPPFIV